MKSLILHSEAAEEIEDGADYYERSRPGYGEAFRAEVDAALAQIGNTPTVFSPYKGGPVRRRLIRRFGYGVYFVERDRVIYVLAVANLRRRPDYWLDRLNDV